MCSIHPISLAIGPPRAILTEYSKYGGGMIDIAPGNRNSESVVGQLIEKLDLSERFFMTSKCDKSCAQATSNQIVDSQEKLKSGKLDLISVHNIQNWQEQLPALQEAKNKNFV